MPSMEQTRRLAQPTLVLLLPDDPLTGLLTLSSLRELRIRYPPREQHP